MGDTGSGMTPTGGTPGRPPPPPPPPAPTAATGSTEVIPIRGGKHHAYGMFIGGSPLDDNYQPTREARLRYRAHSQRRNMKTIGSIESAIIAARDSTTSLKFDGHLEPSVGAPVTEIGKDRFISLLSRKVEDLVRKLSTTSRTRVMGSLICLRILTISRLIQSLKSLKHARHPHMLAPLTFTNLTKSSCPGWLSSLF
jgi:alkanesulfonate monooxygenase SsuD/methylene tetrahydromethanopterin reductase-like flavin-dependent oxidoreductase (luciferase family)